MSAAVLAVAGLSLALSQAARAQFGTCQNCEIVNGCPVVCVDPNWPSCLTQSGPRPVCTPGASFQATVCASSNQSANCTYTCNTTGTAWDRGACTYLPIDINETIYCDYSAGCPAGPGGAVLGKPVKVVQWCTGGSGGATTEVIGACGDKGCVLRPQCLPGKPCPTVTPTPRPAQECRPGETLPDQCSATGRRICVPDGNGGYVWEKPKGECQPGQEVFCPGGSSVVCTPDCKIPSCPAGTPPPEFCKERLGTPSCYRSGNGWVCEWMGVRVSTENPCPTVEHDPFPRGLVGVPMTFRITGGIGSSNSGGSTWACDEVNHPGCPSPSHICNDGTYVTGVRGSVTFYSTAADAANARWLMDDRPQNVGNRSEDIVSPYPGHNGRRVSQIMGGDLTIKNERRGATVSHIYETSSYDKPQNGPSNNWPAYQVQLQTRWHLVSSWQYQVRVWQDYCELPNGNGYPCDCNAQVDPNCALIIHKRRPSYVWHPGPTVSYDADVIGARVLQDAARSKICSAIPVGIVQSQAVLEK